MEYSLQPLAKNSDNQGLKLHQHTLVTIEWSVKPVFPYYEVSQTSKCVAIATGTICGGHIFNICIKMFLR